MLIKKKSLIVALISGFVISLVLVLTLFGYFMYIEFKNKEFKRTYQELLDKTKARVYSRYLEISKIDARIENSGSLKGKPIVEGTIINKGTRTITDLVIKISFIDKDDAVLYETVLRPQEPTLTTPGIPQVTIPYLYTPPRAALKPNDVIKFKKILASCPTEIFVELREGDKPKNVSGKWSGKLTAQAVSLEF